jgi:hypothetical protein
MRLVLPLVGVAAAICMAAPARADATDDQFLASLQAAGIAYPSPDKVISSGRAVCRMAGQGTRMADIVNVIQTQNPGLHGDNAARFTAIAASVYCPSALPARAG